ncbi:MAG: inositol monophosphatase [Candidatus Uhrbacteria bacterium]|nr:inositol monophosphatase [Candidatus Uhrbacteria bacterium]
MDYQKFITEVLQEASLIAAENFGKVTGVVKEGDNNQVLTETDLKIGGAIIGRIKKEFPGYNIIDEEAGVIDNHSEFTWVIDPIDGTSNFASGTPTYGIVLGLLKGGAPIAGGFVLPSFSEIYVAEKNMGACCNGERIQVSQEAQLSNALVAYGIDGHQEDPERTREEAKLLAEIVLGIRNLRSSGCVFDIAMIAKGHYGAGLNRTSKIWDNVAQHIIVEEAGGIYTDFFGSAMDYSDPISKAQNNFTCMAGSPELHTQLLALIKSQNKI